MERHRILIIGGGTAGISVAARLRRAAVDDVALVEPSDVHYYQPLWTLVGGGQARAAETVRPTAKVLPRGVTWIRERAVEVDPEARTVGLGDGRLVGYDFLVVAPGIQLDWDRVPGLAETLGHRGVSSNYSFELAPKTWDLIRELRGGSAVFTMPSGPLKCAGAGQKITYLASDFWRRRGLLDGIDVTLILPTPRMFGIDVWNTALEQVAARYGIDVHFRSELAEVDPDQREVIVTDLDRDTKTRIGYDLLHVVPPQSGPDWLKRSPLARTDVDGFVDVDDHTLQHQRWPNVFSLGDAAGTPNAKTGAAVRKQAPVVVENLRRVMAGHEPDASYDGYSSCPIVTARNRMLLCEFDYTNQPHPTIPLLDTSRERYVLWLLKRYGLPFLYWNLMLKGLA